MTKNHPNIVKLFEIIDDPNSKHLYLVMEYISGGTLLSKIKQHDVKNLRKYFTDIINGIEYCHENAGIIHRDLKPENFLVDEGGNVKIVDFGTALLISEGKDEINEGGASAYFVAPEICKGLSYKGKQSDIWSLGVNLYYLAFYRLPFNATSIPEIYKSIENDNPEYPDNSDLRLVDLIKRMLEKIPSKRISIYEIKAHNWMTDDGKLKLPIVSKTKIVVNEYDLNGAFSTKIKAYHIAKIKIALVRYIKRKRQLKNSKKIIAK